jgi:type IV pilus assembly protein PilV
LIEILIAVVLVSVGFLAGARMQMESMRFSQSAYYRSQAYFMANDIIDRMRANVEGVQDGNYDGGSTSAEQTRPDCTTNRCSPAEIATLDLAEWTDYLNPTTNAPPALPSSATTTATGTINAVGGGQFTVSLVWAEGDDTDQLDIHFLAEN